MFVAIGGKSAHADVRKLRGITPAFAGSHNRAASSCVLSRLSIRGTTQKPGEDLTVPGQSLHEGELEVATREG